MTQYVTVATDGSAISNPHGPAGWAWFVSEDCWAAGAFPKASNQVAELTAILRALHAIPRQYGVLIRTDSQFSINVCTKWMRSWKRPDGSWRKADGQEPSNLALVKALDAALQGRIVRFEWVRGHNGDPMNEIADRICSAASTAQAAGKPILTGPGWTGFKATPVIPQVKPRRAAKKAAAPKAAAAKKVAAPKAGPSGGGGSTRKAAPRRAAKSSAPRVGSGKERLVTGLDDWDSEVVLPRSKERRPDTVLCHSCNAPINPLTNECRCSFTGG